MKTAKISAKELDKIFKKVVAQKLDACGAYVLGDYKIEVKKTKPLSGSERVSLLYQRRKGEGLCVVCGKKVTGKNPRTGVLYRLCETHRKKIDKNRMRAAAPKKKLFGR